MLRINHVLVFYYFFVKDLRRKFAGSVPLPQQEKYSNTMLELQNGKAKIEEELKKVRRTLSIETKKDIIRKNLSRFKLLARKSNAPQSLYSLN